MEVPAGGMARAIYDALRADAQPGGRVRASVEMRGPVVFRAESESLAHLRASLNTALRLAHAARASLESAR